MSQQEDDLRALAKIMDLLRAVSIAIVVLRLTRSQKRENTVEPHLDSTQCRSCAILHELVDAGFTLELHLYYMYRHRLHLYADGRCVYEPTP